MTRYSIEIDLKTVDDKQLKVSKMGNMLKPIFDPKNNKFQDELEKLENYRLEDKDLWKYAELASSIR